MRTVCAWMVIGVVACALSPGNLFAQGAQEGGKKKAGAEKARANQEEQFKKLDANSDGALSADELKAGMRGPMAGKGEDIFKVKDTDGSGSLSLDEFKKTSFEEFALRNGVDPKAGKVTLDDVKKGAKSPERAEEMFKRRDSNGDGVITKEDFAPAKGAKKGGGKRGKKANQ